MIQQVTPPQATDAFYGLADTTNPNLPAGTLKDTTDAGPVTALTGHPSGKNSQVTLSAKAGGTYQGEVEFTYNRLDLQSDIAATLAPDGIVLSDDGYTTVAEVAAAAWSSLGVDTGRLPLTDTDVLNADTDISTLEYPKVITVQASPDSYSYIGQFDITLVSGTMPQMVTLVALDGFNLPQLQ